MLALSKKGASQQSYNLYMRTKKTSLNDCILSESYLSPQSCKQPLAKLIL